MTVVLSPLSPLVLFHGLRNWGSENRNNPYVFSTLHKLESPHPWPCVDIFQACGLCWGPDLLLNPGFQVQDKESSPSKTPEVQQKNKGNKKEAKRQKIQKGREEKKQRQQAEYLRVEGGEGMKKREQWK